MGRGECGMGGEEDELIDGVMLGKGMGGRRVREGCLSEACKCE